MVKYDDDREIMNTYENLQIVRSQFFTGKLILIYIWSNSVFVFDQFDNSKSVFGLSQFFLVNSNSHLIIEFKGKTKFNTVTKQKLLMVVPVSTLAYYCTEKITVVKSFYDGDPWSAWK